MREKLTDKEKLRFYEILRESLRKLDSDKNRKKRHWSILNNSSLSRMIAIEQKELELAIYIGDSEEIKTECFDIINLALFIVDNLDKE